MLSKGNSSETVALHVFEEHSGVVQAVLGVEGVEVQVKGGKPGVQSKHLRNWRKHGQEQFKNSSPEEKRYHKHYDEKHDAE